MQQKATVQADKEKGIVCIVTQNIDGMIKFQN